MAPKFKTIIVPKAIEDTIDEFNSRTMPFALYDVQAELARRRQELKDVTPEENFGAWAEVTAFTLVESQGVQFWGTYFGPLASGSKGDGSPFVAPDIADANADVIALWKHRACSVIHPMLKARYADLVWDLTHKICGERADHEFARVAVNAYLRSVSAETPDEQIPRFSSAFRAWTLAAQVGDRAGINAAKSMVMRLHRETMASCKPIWWMAFDFLIVQPLKSVRDELSEVAKDLEGLLSKHGPPGADFDPHAVEAAGKRLVSLYARLGGQGGSKQTHAKVARAHEQHAAMGDAMLSAIVLQKAVDAYKSAGMQDEADRVRMVMQQRIRDLRTEMRQFSYEFTIPKRDMDEFTDAIVDDNPGVTFVRLAAQFLTSSKEVETQLTKLAKDAPLMAIVGHSTFSEDHVSAVIGSTEDDKLGRAVAQAAQNFGFSRPWLGQAFNKAIDRHDWIPEHFGAWANRLGLFEETTCLVHGFSAWYDGDLVKAIHVLVPQIELGLRRIVERLGKPITKGDPSRPGVSVAIGMGDILYNCEIAEMLGPDLRLHLLALFADSRGLNLRNRVAHGLMKFDEMHEGIVLWLVQSLLVFGIWDQVAEKRR